MTRRALGVTALLGLLVAASAGVAPVAAAPRDADSAPRQRYIVRTHSASALTGVLAGVRGAGGRVEHVYSRAISGFSATLTSDELARVRADRGVESVTLDRLFHDTAIQTDPTWGLDRLDQRSSSPNKSYRYNTTGQGVTAFVLDTGVRLKHQEYRGRARSGHDFVDDDSNASDCNGHGTHVAGTVGGSTYGAAKKVKLVAVRVLNCNGAGWAGDIIQGLDWVIAHKPKGRAVVNMSIGGRAYPLVDEAVERTVAAGIPVVAAAGNDGVNACKSSPGRVPEAITVAAVDSHDTRPSWSNFGKCVDLFAPGVDVRSSFNASNRATEVLSGTSMAAPHVTGLVARYLQKHPRATPAQISTAFTASATHEVVKRRKGSPDRLVYATPPLTAPGPPVKVTASRNSTAQTATIRWAKPLDDGGKAITGYRVSRNGPSSGEGAVVTVSVSAQSRAHTFGSLKKDFAYTLSVRAVNAVGPGVTRSRTVAELP